jgi:hypothetical protein
MSGQLTDTAGNARMVASAGWQAEFSAATGALIRQIAIGGLARLKPHKGSISVALRDAMSKRPRHFTLDVKDGCNILTGMEAVSDRVGGFAG